MIHDDSRDGADNRGAAEEGCGRRALIRGAVVLGAVGVGGALSRIGSGSSSAASVAVAQEAPAPAAATGTTGTAATGTTGTAATGAGTAPAKTAASGAAKGKALGAATAIPVGGGKIFPKERVVVTQPTAGVFKAFDAMCTHEKCILADVSDGTINCACHGGKFSITDGQAVQIPPIEPLPPKTVTVTGGKVFVA